MISASLRGRYDGDVSGAIGTVTVDGGVVKLKANMTDATFVNGPSLESLSLSLEKPGSFLIDYDVPKKVLYFSPTSSVSICLAIFFSLSKLIFPPSPPKKGTYFESQTGCYLITTLFIYP